MKKRIPVISTRGRISSTSRAGVSGKSYASPCGEPATNSVILAKQQKKSVRGLQDIEISLNASMSSEEEISSIDSTHGEESDINLYIEEETDSDGEPAASTAAKVIWISHPPKNKPSIPFLGFPGLNGMPSASTAIEYFSLIFTESIYDLILQETEKNAEYLFLRNPSPRARITDWKPLSREEFKIWLGLIFHMGNIKINRMSDYWKTSKFFNIPIFRKSMARDRFLGILQSLHFATNPSEIEPMPRDRLYKIRPLLDGFRVAMETAVSPGRELCIDESMLPRRQKHGIKMYMLFEPSGLVHRLLIYMGSEDKELGGRGHRDKVVHKLLDNFKNRGHSVFMNNHYSNASLARDLLFEKTYCTGTLRPKRKDNPKEIFSCKLKKGEVASRWSEEGMCVFRWRDKRDIALISSEFGCNFVSTKRPGRDKPEAVIAYNKFMGGVDHCDELLSYYTFEHKSLKWYKKLAIHLFQIMLVNSFILFNKFSGKRKSLYEFRMEIIEYLLSGIHYEPEATLPLKTDLCHLPAFTEIGNTGKKQQKRCRVCHAKGVRKLVVSICPDCEGKPGLCLRPCFQEYHKKL